MEIDSSCLIQRILRHKTLGDKLKYILPKDVKNIGWKLRHDMFGIKIQLMYLKFWTVMKHWLPV